MSSLNQSCSMELNLARKHLSDALGDGMKIYLQMLKSWFKKKISREDFDHEARNLLNSELVHLHNRFLLALLAKCQSLGSSFMTGDGMSSPQNFQPTNLKQLKKPKNKQLINSTVCNTGLYQRFLPADPLCQAPQIQPQFAEQDDKTPEFASRDLLLPDVGVVHGRMAVAAWEFGLDSVDDECIHLLMNAIEVQLKNLLTVVVSRRHSYRMRGRFRHAIGSRLPSFTSRCFSSVYTAANDSDPTDVISQGEGQAPSIKPSLEVAQRSTAIQLSCAGPVTGEVHHSITLFDLYEALQVHKSVLPSHTVYTLNVERILNRLWHPSNEELKQTDNHQDVEIVKKESSARQAAMKDPPPGYVHLGICPAGWLP